jgi:hypothetical protein
MSRLPILTAALLLAAPSVFAAEPPTSGYQQVFLSPAGEPFRAALGQPYPSETWFQGADKNGDGALDPDEFKADAARFFKALDINGNGILESVEVSVYEVKVAPEIMTTVPEPPADIPAAQIERGPNGEPPQYIGGGGSRISQGGGGNLRNVLAKRRGAGLFTFLDEAQQVRNADTDLDFRVSAAEFAAAAGRRFSKLDTDHDGKLARAELPATPVQQLIAAKTGKRGLFGR